MQSDHWGYLREGEEEGRGRREGRRRKGGRREGGGGKGGSREMRRRKRSHSPQMLGVCSVCSVVS
jgi:hypothetical protein